MAKLVERIIVGVDVAKDGLEIHRRDTDEIVSISNTVDAIEAFLKALPGPVAVAIEATNSFHEPFVAQAFASGHEIYLLDAFRLSRYRDAIGGRAKTDRSDAQLLSRYLEREGSSLKPLTPLGAEEKRIWTYLRRRAQVVRTRTRLKLSLKDLPQQMTLPVLEKLTVLADQLEQSAVRLARKLGWSADVERVKSMPGVGELTAVAMVACYRRLPFLNADKFVAYMGLDVRVRDSGQLKGKRRLTKKGDAELRRLMFLAGRSARRTQSRFKEAFEGMLSRGFSKTAADVAMGRKIARIAFALLRTETDYRAEQPA
jgi:transposase